MLMVLPVYGHAPRLEGLIAQASGGAGIRAVVAGSRASGQLRERR
jgi:hypothetical protein